MMDLISREDAIAVVRYSRNAVDGIKNLPSVDAVEVKHGEWVLKDSEGNGVCSVCNRQDHIDPLATHCRFCGAKMDVKRE